MVPVSVIPRERRAAGDAEVHDPGVAFLVDQDVGRLEVPVDDAQTVGLLEPVADLDGDADGLGRAHRPHHPQDALEVLAGHELHGDVEPPAVLAEVEHAADVAVGDAAGRRELVAEALERAPVGLEPGPEDLDGDLLAGPGVEGLEDVAHAALAEVLDDLVAAGEQGPGRELLDGARQGLGQGDAGVGRARSGRWRRSCRTGSPGCSRSSTSGQFTVIVAIPLGGKNINSPGAVNRGRRTAAQKQKRIPSRAEIGGKNSPSIPKTLLGT